MSDNKPFESKFNNCMVLCRKIIDNTGDAVVVSLDGYLLAPLEDVPMEVLQSLFPNCNTPRIPGQNNKTTV